MRHPSPQATYVGGPTALIVLGGLRLLTDPTFDPAGSAYTTPVYTLHKTQDPAIRAEDVEPIDAVLLSHDHHFDNLDHAGRALLARASSPRRPAPSASERTPRGWRRGLAWTSRRPTVDGFA